MTQFRTWLAFTIFTLMVIFGCIYAIDQALRAGADDTTDPKPGPTMGHVGATTVMNMAPSTLDTPSAKPQTTATPWKP